MLTISVGNEIAVSVADYGTVIPSGDARRGLGEWEECAAGVPLPHSPG